MSDHRSEMNKAYQAATIELRKHHNEEFALLLSEQYEQRGINVKRRLRGEAKRLAEIAKHKAALSVLESESSV